MPLVFYFTSCVLNMLRKLIYPSTGACDYYVELAHFSCCSGFEVCWRFRVVGLGWVGVVTVLQAEAQLQPSIQSLTFQVGTCHLNLCFYYIIVLTEIYINKVNTNHCLKVRNYKIFLRAETLVLCKTDKVKKNEMDIEIQFIE